MQTFRLLKGWIRKHKYGVIGFCLCKVMYDSLQYVPISNRVHLVPPYKIASAFGSSRCSSRWKELAEENAGQILGPTSPESIRVQQILTEIVQAMHDMLGLQKNCKVSVFVPEKNDMQMSENASLVSGIRAKSDLVSSKPRRFGKLGLKYGTKHLDGLNWEVMVVDSDESNAYYLKNGKIMIYTGGFKELKNPQSRDLWIANTLGHEVGHAVAQHQSEFLMLPFWFIPIMLILAVHPCMEGVVFWDWILAIIASVNKRQEFEADYIGIMLMAAAGYDPRFAALSWEKKGYSDEDRFSDHPSSKKRAKWLSRVDVVKKATDVYVSKLKDGKKVEHLQLTGYASSLGESPER